VCPACSGCSNRGLYAESDVEVLLLLKAAGCKRWGFHVLERVWVKMEEQVEAVLTPEHHEQ
jgi:hypothetical protein